MDIFIMFLIYKMKTKNQQWGQQNRYEANEAYICKKYKLRS